MKCILCGTQLEKYLFKNGFWIYQCPECALAQTDLKKDYPQFVKEFYSQGYYEGDSSRSAYADYEKDKPYIIRNMKKFLSFFRKYKPSGTLLDVGCAYGYFVEMAKASGYDAFGFDPSTHAANKAKKLVGSSYFQEATIQTAMYPKNSFDIITLFDVFEHLQDPVSDMKKLNSLLKKDGVIIIATGNTQSLASRLMKRRWTFYIPPQHIFFFNRINVSTLLHETGFVPFEWHKVGKWLSLGYVLHLARTTGESKLAKWLYEWISKTPLMRLPLYVPMKDNMVILCRKK